MRLLRITTNYTEYLDNFYNNHPELKCKNYQGQYLQLMKDCYGWADFWTHSLAKQGYEVWEPVVNAEYMQKTWADENGVNYANSGWESDIITEQIIKFKPDVLFVNTGTIYKSDFIDHIRNKCKTLKLVITWCGTPVSNIHVYKGFDLILCNIPNIVNLFKTNGHNCEYFCHAFEPRILNYIDQNLKGKIDFSFIGSIYMAGGYHNKRAKLLKQLIKRTNIELYTNIAKPVINEKLIVRFKNMVVSIIESLPFLENILIDFPRINKYLISKNIDKTIADRSHRAVFGMPMYQKLFESSITFNNHIDISSEYASNMRLFEGTGVGTCVLTEYQKNLNEIFEPEKEVVTYKCIDEAIEKVDYLLKNKADLYAISNAGQARTLRDHTFDKRAEQLNLIIKSYLN